MGNPMGEGGSGGGGGGGGVGWGTERRLQGLPRGGGQVLATCPGPKGVPPLERCHGDIMVMLAYVTILR